MLSCIYHAYSIKFSRRLAALTGVLTHAFNNFSSRHSYSVSGKLLYYSDVPSTGYNVTYDKRSFIINGNHALLLSGSVHYTRSTPAMWDGLFQVSLALARVVIATVDIPHTHMCGLIV